VGFSKSKFENETEFEILKKNGFKPVDRSFQHHILQINPKISYDYKVSKVSGLRYCIIRDVLQNPDDFVSIMKMHPGYGGSIRVSTPGIRQLFSPLEFSTLMEVYGKVYNVLTLQNNKPIPKIWQWACCSNILYKGVRGNSLPHHDNSPMSVSLWLTKDIENTGTGLYGVTIDGKKYYNSFDIPEDKKHKLAELITKDYYNEDPLYGFVKDDDWELYELTPYEYNSAVLFDSRYFHRWFYDSNKWNEDQIRYSLVSFLQN